ncbi:MAG: hypothetical protein DDG60_02740 [Anaerolineae bacterium]|nr:MAG: hypothetical protein DDG60_02740 [Anaerolineae bacterium]
MDAIKAALRAGNKPEALEMYRDYFKTELGDAQTAIEQIEYNLKFETVAVQPDVEKPTSAEPAAPAASRSNVALMASEPAPKGKIPAWVWGCVAAFILLCCVCVLLPALFYALLQNFSFS